MRDVDPDEYETEKINQRGSGILEVNYPNSMLAIDIDIDGIYANIEEKRRESDLNDIGECSNCNNDLTLRDTRYKPCQDCWEASLKAAENWADEHTDELLGDQL